MTWTSEPTTEGFYWAIWTTGGLPEIVYYNADLEEVETFGEDYGYAVGNFSLFWGPLEPPDAPEG